MTGTRNIFTNLWGKGGGGWGYNGIYSNFEQLYFLSQEVGTLFIPHPNVNDITWNKYFGGQSLLLLSKIRVQQCNIYTSNIYHQWHCNIQSTKTEHINPPNPPTSPTPPPPAWPCAYVPKVHYCASRFLLNRHLLFW
jgi:hypothetical protein